MKNFRLPCAVLGLALALPVLPAAVAPAQAQVAASCSSVWVVRPGDTLSRIARACGVSPGSIQRANPRIDWNRLPVGARISLDGRGAGAAPAPGPMPSYVVRRGDTLSSVARAFGVSVQALLAANPGLSERDLQVGRQIVLGHGGAQPPRPPRPGSEQGRVAVSIDDSEAVPGGMVAFQVSGLRPGERIVVATNPGQGFAGADRGVRAGNRGVASVELDLPGSARPGQRWAYEVFDESMRPIASGAYRIGEPRGRPGTPGRPGGELARVIGVLSNEGATCPTLRGDDGRLYSIAGDLQGYRGGDRVEIIGEIAEMSACMQGTTIAPASIRPAR